MSISPRPGLILCCVAFACVNVRAADPVETAAPAVLDWEKDAKPFVKSIEPVWKEPGYHAFTDLIRFQGRIYCSFREGAGHVPGKSGANGRIRIVRADDPSGRGWKSVALLEDAGVDLRDPKLSETPDGRLMVIMGGSYYRGEERFGMQGRVSFSDTKGADFSAPKPIVLPEKITTKFDWLWRVTWHGGIAWGAVQQIPPNEPRSLQLVKSRDGITWEHVATLDVPVPSETTLRFDAADTMFAFIRASGNPARGWLGTASAPYTQWELKQLPEGVGGPNFVQLPGGGWLAGTRRKGKLSHTMIGRLDFARGELVPLFALPSAGDNSYPGFVVDEDRGEVLVSYYSAHERKEPAIYLARLDLAALRKIMK